MDATSPTERFLGGLDIRIMAKYPGPNKRRRNARKKKHGHNGKLGRHRGKHSGSYARLKHDMQQRGKWTQKK